MRYAAHRAAVIARGGQDEQEWMETKVYWIYEKLGVMARPRGGDWLADEIESLREQGVDVLVSLLSPDEIDELDLANEANACCAAHMRFISFPIRDRCVPENSAAALQLVRELHRMVQRSMRIVLHCRNGIGRASMIAAAMLAKTGINPGQALSIIATVRGCPVPDTPEQIAWLDMVADHLR